MQMLELVKGDHSECISLQIPSQKNVIDIIRFLNNEYTEANNVKNKINRKSIQIGIKRIIE